MKVNNPDYFSALGYKRILYDPQKNEFAANEIIDSIKSIQSAWKEKYPLMNFKTQNLRFDSLTNFDLTFTNEIEFLNMELK